MRRRRPSVVLRVMDLDRMTSFFEGIGWTVVDDVVSTPGGEFALAFDAAPPRLELAISVPDALVVDEVLAIVDDAGGIVMEPAQETGFGGWGGSFNDPEGNTWELGAPATVTAVDLFLSTGTKPPTNVPIVALAVPRRRLPETV